MAANNSQALSKRIQMFVYNFIYAIRRATRNFRGQDVHSMKGVLFIRRYSLWIFFHSHKWRKYCGKFTDSVAMKSNESYFNSLLGQGEKKGARGEAPEYCRYYFVQS